MAKFQPHFAKINNLNTFAMQEMITINPVEPYFYYLTDHLGSSSYITNDIGQVTQTLAYLPFGEDWVNLTSNQPQYETPYKFNGKEKDEETGFNYYGARYYYDELSIWLSVDPLASKYPHQTNYVYCSNNPIMKIDPDGRDEWEFTAKGGMKNVKQTPNDIFYKVDEEGNRTGEKIKFKEKIVKDQFSLSTKGGKKVNYLEINNKCNAQKLFKKLDKYTSEQSTEWGNNIVKDADGNKRFFIGTNDEHIHGSTYANAALFENGYEMLRSEHNHPSNNNASSKGDIHNARIMQSKFPDLELYNFTQKHGYTKYDKNTPYQENQSTMLPDLEIKR